jgi:thiamine kinase-like enzyme
MQLSMTAYQELEENWRDHLQITHVEHFSHFPGSPNAHFRASCHQPLLEEIQYFIKVTSNAQAHHYEHIALQIIATQVDPDMQPVAEGVCHTLYYWRAFRWMACSPIQPKTENDYKEIGRVLGKMHNNTSHAIFSDMRRLSLGSSLMQELEDLQQANPLLGARVALLVEWLVPYEKEWFMYERLLPLVLLHRDFGWRNVVRKVEGTLMIVDYEHVALGPWYLDLAKCLDRELYDPQHLKTFLQGYIEITRYSLHDIPKTYALATRLWGSARFLYHGIKHNDPTSIEHGLIILERLEDEFQDVQY